MLGCGTALAALLLAEPAAHTPSPDRPSDLRDRWTEVLTARSRLENPDAEVRAQLRELDKRVDTYLRQIRASRDVASVFERFPLGADKDPGNLTTTTTYLQAMARAWATPASRWSGDVEVLEQLDAGLLAVMDAGYRAGEDAYGAWFQWEIGTPRPLADIACLLRDELPTERITSVLDAIDHFIPDPRRSALNDYPSTGANRVNTTRAALIAALVRDDATRMQECVDALVESWGEPIRRDGFYPDGGFIQHVNVAYNGSYGVEWLKDVADLLTLLVGSEHAPADLAPVWRLVDDAILPVMVRGHVADAFRGRAVARVRRDGTAIGRVVIASIVQLAALAPRDVSARWLGLMARWAGEGDPRRLLHGTDVPSAAVLAPARSASPDAAEPPGSRYYASIDRLVHRGRTWTAVLSLSSSRIAAYESSETENTWGGRTGNRMRYVYLDDDPAPFDDGYWSTLDYARPPGTTNHSVELRENLTDGDGSTTPDGDWTGGFVLGGISAVGFHQTGLGGDAPRCRTLTVCTPDRIVEVVGDVITAHPPVLTTVENRPVMATGRPRLIINGIGRDDVVSSGAARWAHVEGVGGYVFLTAPHVRATVETRTGSDRQAAEPAALVPADERIERTWTTLTMTHRSAAQSEAWVLLPGASADDTQRVAEEPTSGSQGVAVLRNDGTAQVVTIGKDTTIAAVWAPTGFVTSRGLDLQVMQPLVVGVREDVGGRLLLRIAEPTQRLSTLVLLVSGTWQLSEVTGVPADRAHVRQAGSATRCEVDVGTLSGRAITVVLRTSQ